MKSAHWTWACLFAFALGTVVGTAAPPPEGEKDEVKKPAAKENVSTGAHRSSKLVGMEVKNSAGEALGKVEDLVIDDKGMTRYAAISFGGFLGFGNKLFAVPWRAVALKRDVDSDALYVEFNIDKKRLENAPGFPSDKWPDFGDQSFIKSIETYYPPSGEIRIKTERRAPEKRE